MNKKLINLSNLQKFLLKLNERFALKKAMKGITEDSEGNIIIGEEGLVPTPDENSKGKFLRSDGEWALPSETAVYDSMTIEEGIAGVSKVDKVLNAKNLKQIVNSDGFLTSLDSSKLTGVINIENLPQGALERILIVSSKEERLTLSDTEVQLGDVVKESDTGLMYYVINTEKLNSEEGYTQFTAGSASSVPWSGVTNKPTIPTKTSELTNDSDFAIDSDVVHTSGNETVVGVKTFTRDDSNAAIALTHGSFKKGDVSDVRVACLYTGDGTSYANSLNVYDVGTSDSGNITATSIVSIENTAGESGASKRTSLQIVYHKKPSDGRKQYATLSGDFLPSAANTYNLGSESNPWARLYCKVARFTDNAMRKITGYTQGGTISSDFIGGEYQIVDENDKAMGAVATYFWKNGYNNTYLTVYNQDPNNRKNGRIGVAYNTTKDFFFGFCPTPPKADNSNAIATTEWVTTKDSNAVHKTGDETISGQKTINQPLIFNNTTTSYAYLGSLRTVAFAKGDDITGYYNQYNGFTIVTANTNSKNENRFISVDGSVQSNGNTSVGMHAFSTKAGSTYASISVGYNRASDTFTTYAPTPPANDNSTQIATTAWVTAKDNNVVHTSGNETIDGTKTFSNKIKGNLQGNADTSTQFSANKSVTLTGDVTGTASSKGGWSVSTTLANSGVTAGSYGPSANVTGNNNATISVPQITVDAKGRVTSVVNRTLTCKNNTYTVPTKVSQLTNDSKFVNTTQLATKANDADVVHKSGDEDINGTKSFKTMPKIAGTYLGNEASGNESTCLYLTSKRDTIDKSGAYLVRFRQNREQGALEGVSYISQDILENGTRYPRVLVSGLAFGSDFTPSYYYLSSQSSVPCQLGIEGLPWDKAYLTDCYVGNTLDVKGDVWVGGDQLVVTSDESEVFTGRRVSWAKNANTLPSKPYNLNIGLGGNNSMSWANRIGGFRVALNTIGDVETAMYAHDTTGASKGQGMIGIYYKRSTDSYETIAPTPPAGDNSTQIATTAWVTAKDNNVVHKTGNETVVGVKTFTRDDSNAAIALTHGSFKKGDASDVRVACLYTGDGTSYANSLNVYDVGTSDSGNITATSITSIENTAGESGASKRTSLQIIYHKNPTDRRKQYATLSGDFLPSASNTYYLGNSSFKWKSIYGNLVGNADSATYATTQATTDNSTKIATTAWVRSYVNSVVGSGSVGASISAYYSNAATLTKEDTSSALNASGPFPAAYSDYINIAPTVGTIYTGSQLFSSLTPTASGTIFRPPTGSGGTASYLTTAKATATFSGAFSSSAKYLCTTANAVRFRAYVSQGTNSTMGSPSVVNNSSAKSIFIRVQ